MKPINMKTWEVRAILDNRKKVTRRVVKPHSKIPTNAVFGYTFFTPKGCISARGGWTDGNGENRYGENFFKIPYLPGDTLYVRETWKQAVCDYAGGGYGLTDIYIYKADEPVDTTRMMVEGKWHPSTRMPKEAARIFLRVTGVRVERLQEITHGGIEEEGIVTKETPGSPYRINPFFSFKILWDSMLKGKDRALYGWDANPWVWVIEFERVSGEEAK